MSETPRSLPRLSDEESFWECVRLVCERVKDAYGGPRSLGLTTIARAEQVLDQIDEMKARGSVQS